jgi:hypothetical protein
MPRKLRVEYPGAMYHGMSRGDRCENIFLDDVDRQDFLKTLAEGCQKAGWQVHAYCLIGELGTSKSANARLHQFMTPLSPSDPRQAPLRICKEMNHAMG